MMKRPAKYLFGVLFGIGFGLAAQAQIVEEKISWNPAQAKVMPVIKATSLSQQKKLETEKKWSECANVAQANNKKYSNIRGWLLTSWLRCAREQATEKKTVDSLLQAIKAAEAQPQLFLSGPWRTGLWAELVKGRFAVVEQVSKTSPEESWKQIEYLMSHEDLLEKSQKAKVMLLAGELAQAKAQMKAAQSFYEQSLLLQETKAAREKLNAVLFALNEKKEVEEKPKSDIPSEVEGNYEERFRNSLKSNDLLNLLEDCISYLKQFPGGRRSKWAQEKVSEIYLGLLEQSNDDKMNALRERAIGAMEKADSFRLLEWARQLHKKSDFRGSQRLAERALDGLGSSSSGAVLLYMAGRSAQLVGDYKRARKLFEQYVEQFSGAEDISEVYFRLGLTHLRMGQASSAIAVFEKMLLLKNGDRYELNAKYWLARSLQATNNTRALSVVDEILTRYPLSYYGLRLRMERT
ncbi:MAG: tetratricopeptide repeat protein, partial [Pseudobdellovibrionaceae bacterium]